MSNDMFNSSDAARAEQERLRRQNAELQRDAAVNVAADNAVQRDAALNVAADRSVERDIAANYAAAESMDRQSAEQNEYNARVAANQASYQAAHSQTESNVLRENLAAERAESSNANFGFMMMAFCILAALIGLGIWYFTSNPTTTVYTGQPASPVSSTTTTTTSEPNPPVNVNVQPPASSPVIVNPPSQPSTPAASPNVNVDIKTHSGEANPSAKPSDSGSDAAKPDEGSSSSDTPKSDSGTSSDSTSSGKGGSGGQ